VKLLIAALLAGGGILGGLALGLDGRYAAALGFSGLTMVCAGAWLLYDSVDGRRF